MCSTGKAMFMADLSPVWVICSWLIGWSGLSRHDLQRWEKYLSKTLVLAWNGALREKFNFYFPAVFCWCWQNFHFGVKAGHWAIVQYNKALEVSWYFLIFVLSRSVLYRSVLVGQLAFTSLFLMIMLRFTCGKFGTASKSDKILCP